MKTIYLLPILLLSLGVAPLYASEHNHTCTLTIGRFQSNGEYAEREYRFAANEIKGPKIDGLFSRKMAKKTLANVEAIGLFFNEQVASAELIHRDSNISTIQAVGNAEPEEGVISVQTNLSYPQNKTGTNATETALLRCETKEGKK